MDHAWLESIERRLARNTPRRGVLRFVVGAALGAVGLGAGQPASAACRDAGKPCKRGGQCCSGRCAGKKRKKRCKSAPGQGICTAKNNACFGDDRPEVVCSTSAGVDCLCFRTKSGEAFCADTFAGGATSCAGDDDCVAALGDGARCIKPAAACGQQAVCKLPCPVILEPIP